MADLSRTDGGLRELALFAGAGGGILGGHLLGWQTVCAVEYDPYAASILVARQNDGLLPPFPIWDDVRTFDGRAWRGRVDVVSGGFPCQDISAAGKGAGIEGERSRLWLEMARVISEVRPRFAFVENSPMLTSRGLGVVLGDLAAMGFDARWGVLGAADVGAPHKRERIWIVATLRDADVDSESIVTVYDETSGLRGDTDNTNGEQLRGLSGRIGRPRRTTEQTEPADDGGAQSMANPCRDGLERQFGSWPASRANHRPGMWSDPGWWESEPNVGRVADGVAARMDRLKAIGNGQVPLCAAEAWRILTS